MHDLKAKHYNDDNKLNPKNRKLNCTIISQILF